MSSSQGIYRILVADDEPTIRSLLQEALREKRHFVQACSDGEDVFRRLAKAEFSVLILDSMMPGPSGFEIVRRLREEGRSVPVVLMTDLEPAEAARMCEGAELVTILRKPFMIRDLWKAVEKVAGRIRS